MALLYDLCKNLKKTVIAVTSKNLTGTLSKAQEVLEENDLEVFSVKQIRNYADRTITIKFKVKYASFILLSSANNFKSV